MSTVARRAVPDASAILVSDASGYLIFVTAGSEIPQGSKAHSGTMNSGTTPRTMGSGTTGSDASGASNNPMTNTNVSPASPNSGEKQQK